MQSFSTPMMKQYSDIKKQYPDCLLFFRMGDFYELFLEDAQIGAKVLNITLTSKAGGKDGRIPMAGVPYHAVDPYLAKLVKAGYKVAICEQVSEPTKYGLVDREVIRIVTPGTLLDERILDKKENNYVMSIVIENKNIGLAVADISTGQFLTNQFSGNVEQIIRDELARLHAAECILSDEDYNKPILLGILKNQKDLNIFPFKDWDYAASNSQKNLKNHFKIKSLAVYSIETKPLAIVASGVLLSYLKNTQKERISHIKKINVLSSETHMLLDRSTLTNLELFSTIREHEKQGSLVHLLDSTVTAMGARMFRDWIRKPLLDKKEIEDRYQAVETFVKDNKTRESLRKKLEEVGDIERLLSKLSVGIGNPRDVVNLAASLKVALSTKEDFSKINTQLMKILTEQMSEKVLKIITIIQHTIVDDPPIVLKEGRIIRAGISSELDELKLLVSGCREWIADFEKKEKERTGIATLKVRFNEVFGFFIEISKANVGNIPSNYIRKQTMVNGERYITKELKEKEEHILTAEEKINKIEYSLYCDVLENVLTYTTEIQNAAHSIGILDCLLNFAYCANKYEYKRPTLTNDGSIKILNGRHPVVETVLETSSFVPNDVLLDHKTHQLLIITGPNMAGKSVLIRQVALIVLLAQIGSFVPADKAEISIVDRIYVRSGASDVITAGLSTFMLEMVETAQILNSCTDRSLIVMDEIGRGTSTYDGISIAWAVAEHLATQGKVGPKTLFATHYHELQKLAESFPMKIKNYHMAVEKQKNEPIFLHTLLPGAASHSYGVDVAKMAGIPESVTRKAAMILHSLEKEHEDILKQQNKGSNQHTTHDVIRKVNQIDINKITPLESMQYLAELKELTKTYEN